MNDNSSKVIDVDINDILPNRFQPRIKFNEEEILELSDSIKEHGVIQPLVVRTIGDKYEIIAGERRYKASVLAGKDTVPVIVKNLNDKESAEIALIENVQRKNLTPIEEALSYKKILDMGYITQENLATKLGKSQPAVANKIRLLNLTDEVQEALLENRISERHARSLLKLPTSELQNKMLDRIINERLTVRRADEEIEKMKNETSEERTGDSQKIIEKGEINMNNNMFGTPNVPQNPQTTTPNFDIFGNMPQQPVVEPPTQPQMPSFDIFGGSQPVATPVQQQPVVESAPVMPSMPTFEPTQTPPSVNNNVVMPEIEPTASTTGNIQFNANGTVIAVPSVESHSNVVEPQQSVVEQPIQTTAPSFPEFPSFPSMPEISQTISAQESTINPSIENAQPIAEISTPIPESTSVVPEITIPSFEVPQQPVVEQPIQTEVLTEPKIETVVPQTSPIMESPSVVEPIQMTQQSENLFSFGSMPQQPVVEQSNQPEVSTVPEFKMPEPIIITDYSKQYDPVMPPSPQDMQPTVDFKEVINAIRECSNKIEQYGFKIDVEEYDLTNLYQVIFKIEK